MGNDYFEGHRIDQFQGRFSGTFDIDVEDGRSMGYGDRVILLVVAEVNQSLIRQTPGGEVRRVNVLKPVSSVFVSDPEVGKQFGLTPKALGEVGVETDVPDSGFTDITEQVDAALDEAIDIDTAIAEIRALEAETTERMGPHVKYRDPMLARFLEGGE